MISVADALDALFALVEPLPTEAVPLRNANGRVLAADVVAQRDQPPFAASAMDGYAVGQGDVAPGARLQVVGEAAAGHVWEGRIQPGQALRIFTGAPMPAGADHVIIQENVTREGDQITLDDSANEKPNVRPAGVDFAAGYRMQAPRLLGPSDIALLAAMNVATVTVTKRPEVALIATGDELVQPGEQPRDDQIITSNSYGLATLFESIGARPLMLPIARDTQASLELAFDLAKGADLIVTIGGASVGDHDLVADVAAGLGMEQAFYKVAMRPGKPLMAGRMTGAAMIGLPGNPVSAMVCGYVFAAPMIRKMLGLGEAATPRELAPLAAPIAANGPREHYVRAHLGRDGVRVFEKQDSSLLTVLTHANCLVVRPPHDPQRDTGHLVDIIRL
ncbi:MAG: gephyrin-like molybdotransferase Glp [Pseudomonadota bacterium]